MMISIINTYANTICMPKISQQLFNKHDIKYEIEYMELILSHSEHSRPIIKI